MSPLVTLNFYVEDDENLLFRLRSYPYDDGDMMYTTATNNYHYKHHSFDIEKAVYSGTFSLQQLDSKGAVKDLVNFIDYHKQVETDSTVAILLTLFYYYHDLVQPALLQLGKDNLLCHN